MSERPRYGFVGLGNLGGHLAASLARAGFDLAVHDRDRALAERHAALGAAWAEDPAAAARGRDAVITCLPSPAASEAVLAELLPAMRAGATWIEVSTLGRDDILRLADLAAAAGVQALEAPVTGGVHLAARGEITVLAGGDADLLARHEPALRAMGDRVIHMGPLGSAAVIKVITNMLAFVHLVADGEALMLARRAGLDLGRAWEAIAASSGTSFVHETEGQLILNGSYDVAFTMDLALKDLGFAMDFGREFGVPLDLAGRAREAFLRGRAAYGGQAQSTQVVKLLEDALGVDLRAPGFPARLE
jgi:3-hydroxyisobutyrate dehydrogenase